MFSDDVAQVQALHKIMEQLMTRKQRAEEIIWETLADVIYLRTGNAVRPGELEQDGGVVASGRRHHYVSGEPAVRRSAATGDGDDSDVDSVFSDDEDEAHPPGSKSKGKGGSRAAAAAMALGGEGVGGRTIPRAILDSEVDLEADEIRCLEDNSSDLGPLPHYADPVLALRILTEALARLGRLEDIERVMGENVERELRRIAQTEQARTYARMERRRGGRRGFGAAEGGGGMMGQLAESDEAMRDFRVHLSNLLVSFGSVVLRLSHLAQIVRHTIMTDPQLIGRYADPSAAMHAVLETANNYIQREIKSFLEACLNENEDADFMYDGMADEGRGVSSHERGIFSLGIITDSSSNKDSRSATNIASRASIMELTSDKFVTNVLFARTNMIPQTRHALTFRRKQGIGGFYRGVQVNIARACVLNATKMGVYDMTKGYVTNATGWARKDVRTAFSSSFVAGFFMTCTVAPWDMLRTKLMNQPPDKKIYDGFSDCLVKTVKSDGVLSLWRGFIPIWARFAPQATLQLLTIEFLYGFFGFKSI